MGGRGFGHVEGGEFLTVFSAVFVCAFICTQPVEASPAAPVEFELIQPDGTTIFTAHQWGDEWNNGVETLEGYTIIQMEDDLGFIGYLLACRYIHQLADKISEHQHTLTNFDMHLITMLGNSQNGFILYANLVKV